MKSHLRFSGFLLTACLCASIVLPANAQEPTAAPRSITSSPSQLTPSPATTADGTTEYVLLPGPLRSFLRMAALSQEIAPDEILPLLAHHIAVYGYEGSKTKAGKPTEYLNLLERYIQRGKEMQLLAGKQEVVHVADCATAGPLLEIIGYRLRVPCGPDTSLETDDPERAFITIDSGFPLVDLEETLRGGKPFEYKNPSARVPVLFTAKVWAGKWSRPAGNPGEGSDFESIILGDVPNGYQHPKRSTKSTRDTKIDSARFNFGVLRDKRHYSRRQSCGAGRHCGGSSVEITGRGQPDVAHGIRCAIDG